MAAPVKIEKYQILVAPDSKKVQGLRTGDIVRRQYFDGTNTIYSLMCVLDYGTTQRSVAEVQYDLNGQPLVDSDGNILTTEVTKDVPYFIGALLEGDAPKTTELLDFSRVTNLFDTSRSGALYLTASDDQAPFMDVVDGIGRNKSLCWPENIASEAFEDSRSQYIVRGACLTHQYKGAEDGNNRIIRLTKISASTSFSGLSQEFYELIAAQKRVLVSYKARASKPVTVKAEIAYSADNNVKDAEWSEEFSKDWHYHFQVINILRSGRHLRSFQMDLQSLGVGDWVEIADFNIILLDSISNFGDATSMRIGKLDGVSDPVFGTLNGYGAYLQKLYASQTAHISGTLTAGDENGFASTFYAGKIHRNCFWRSLDINFLTSITIDNETLLNPTGMGHTYKTEGSSELNMVAQSREWLDEHIDKRYCFSLWAYAKKPCQISIKQNGKLVGTIQIASDQTHEWRRLHVFFDLIKPAKEGEEMIIGLLPTFSNSLYQPIAGGIDPDEQVLFLTAPQLESGEYCTQYQPTDDILDYTEDYGAWFARGGIGGTIQNPLLRLNYDGSGAIDTRENSFRLNQDGSGFLAKKNIQWDNNGKVTFGKDVTLNWDNLSEETKQEISSKSLKIIGERMFVITNKEGDDTETVCTPESINLSLEEIGFKSTSSQRQWFLLCDNEWVLIPNENGSILNIAPESHFWLGLVEPDEANDGNVDYFKCNSVSNITFRCVVTINDTLSLSDTFTISKQFLQGYTIEITSSKGNTFHNGVCSTILTANVYYQGQLLSQDYVLENFSFYWRRYNINDPDTDLGIDDLDVSDGDNILTINYELNGTEIFECEMVPAKHFDYSFPVIF